MEFVIMWFQRIIPLCVFTNHKVIILTAEKNISMLFLVISHVIQQFGGDCLAF